MQVNVEDEEQETMKVMISAIATETLSLWIFLCKGLLMTMDKPG